MKTIPNSVAAALIAITACAPTTQLSANRIDLSQDLDRQVRVLASRDLIDPESTRFRGLRA